MQHITFDDVAHEHMLQLLEAVELEPGMLGAELEGMEPQLYVEVNCQCYHQKLGRRGRERKAMRWRKAVCINCPLDLHESFDMVSTDSRMSNTQTQGPGRYELVHQTGKSQPRESN